MKVTIAKMTAEGEQLNGEVEIPTKWMEQAEVGRATLLTRLRPLLDLMDDRLREMNGRIMEMNRQFQGLSPEARVAVTSMLDVLRGLRVGVEQPRLEVTRQEAEQLQGGTVQGEDPGFPGGVAQ